MNNEETAKSIQFPPIPESLIVELNRRFPEMCADLEWDEKTVWHVSGQRSVIRFLNAIYNDQNENILKGD